MASGGFDMMEISFFNHYFQKFSPTAESFNEVLREEEIFLLEKPRLCQFPLEPNLPSVVLVHGAREIESSCYDRIREAVIRNPQTKFFISSLSLGFGDYAVEKVRKRIGQYPNYIPMVGFNYEECFDEIIKLAKSL